MSGICGWVGEADPSTLDAMLDVFRSEYVTNLRVGKDQANELRPRRIGEKLWALLMLELWLRSFIDGRGRSPS